MTKQRAISARQHTARAGRPGPPLERKHKFAIVLCGVIAVGLFVLTGYLTGSTLAHLGLTGQSAGLRITHCASKGTSTTSRGGDTGSHLDCTGLARYGGATHRITATGFSSYPISLGPVEVAREPWGTWVPVDRGGWDKAGRALSPLIPLVFALLFAKGAVLGQRRWRNSRRLPTGSSE